MCFGIACRHVRTVQSIYVYVVCDSCCSFYCIERRMHWYANVLGLLKRVAWSVYVSIVDSIVPVYGSGIVYCVVMPIWHLWLLYAAMLLCMCIGLCAFLVVCVIY